jgi:hypothetical protein
MMARIRETMDTRNGGEGMMLGPANFALGRRAYERRCKNRPPTPQGRIDCAASWQPYIDNVRQRLTQRLGSLPFTLEESDDSDHSGGDMGALGLLRVTVEEAWDRWQEWAVFVPVAARKE